MTENTPNSDFNDKNYSFGEKKPDYICLKCSVFHYEIPKRSNKEQEGEEEVCGCGSKLFSKIEEWIEFKS